MTLRFPPPLPSPILVPARQSEKVESTPSLLSSQHLGGVFVLLHLACPFPTIPLDRLLSCIASPPFIIHKILSSLRFRGLALDPNNPRSTFWMGCGLDLSELTFTWLRQNGECYIRRAQKNTEEDRWTEARTVRILSPTNNYRVEEVRRKHKGE